MTSRQRDELIPRSAKKERFASHLVPPDPNARQPRPLLLRPYSNTKSARLTCDDWAARQFSSLGSNRSNAAALTTPLGIGMPWIVTAYRIDRVDRFV
jgi:hypothetical protein